MMSASTTPTRRIAVITGGGTGIGRAQAIALTGKQNDTIDDDHEDEHDDVTVIIAGRRKEPLEQVQKEIGISKCHIMPGMDVGKPDCWKALVAKVQEVGAGRGELHFLGNTAGDVGLFGPNHPYESIDPEYLIHYNTTYMTSIELSYHFMAPLLAKGAESSGKPSVVVNIGSTAGILSRGNAGQVAPMYAPVKMAIEHITRCAYSLYKDQNILSYGINPVVYASRAAENAAAMCGSDLQTLSAAFNPYPVIGNPHHVAELSVAWFEGTSEVQQSGMHYLMGPLSDESSIVFPLDQHRATLDSVDPLILVRVWSSISEAYTQDGKQMTQERLNDFRKAMKAKVEKNGKRRRGYCLEERNEVTRSIT